MPRVFLSHSGADTADAIALRERLLADTGDSAGIEVWLDKTDIKPGRIHWQQQIEEAIQACDAFIVLVGANGIVNWVEPEVRLGLSRATTAKIRFIPVLTPLAAGSSSLPPFARQYQAVRDPLSDDEAFAQLTSAILGVAEWRPEPISEPFVGLRSMREGDARLFFGREAELERLVRLMQNERLVAIVSDSGAGKSSLARAGLSPAFRGGVLEPQTAAQPPSRIRHVVTMHPGTDPMRGLRDAVDAAAISLDVDGEGRAGLRKRVKGDDVEELVHALNCNLPFTEVDTLLIVDQAEELLVQTPAEARHAFLDLLLALATPRDEGGGGIRVLLTVRADYFNLFSGHDAFFARLNQAPERTLLRLARLTDDEIQEVVEKPLHLAGHDDADDYTALVAAIRRDTLGRPSDTALIQFALWSAWKNRAGGGSLTEAYTASGGVFGAMGAEAERVRALLPKAEQASVLPLFARLVQPSDTGGATARIAPLAEFDDARVSLAGRLAGEEAARLLQVTDNEVQIAHEALIRQWPWLQSQLEEAGNDIRLLHRLIGEAAKWAEENRSNERLPTGAALEEFAALIRRRSDWPSDDEKGFVVAADERRNADQARDVRRQHRIRRLATVASVVAFVALGTAGAAWIFFLDAKDNAEVAEKYAESATRNAAEAQEQREIAEANTERAQKNARDAEESAAKALRSQRLALAALSASELRSGRPVEAVHLALAAWPRRPDPGDVLSDYEVALTALSEAGSAQHELRRMTGHEGWARSVAFSPDGTRIVSGGQDGTVRLWDADSGAQIGNPMTGHEYTVLSVAFSPDGRGIISGGADGTIRFWDAGTSTQIGEPMTGHEREVTSVAFSPDGARILSGGTDGTIRLWNPRSGIQVGDPLAGPGDPIVSVAFSPEGARIVGGAWDGTVRLWDAGTGTQIGDPMTGHEGWVLSATFSPDGAHILSGGSDGTIRLWDAGTGTQIGDPMTGHDYKVWSVAFSPDGTRIVSGGDDGTVRLWDSGTDTQIGNPMTGHEYTVLSVAFSPDGRGIVSGGADGTIRFWDAGTSTQIGEPMTGHEGEVRSVTFSPDGARIVSGGRDGTLRIWDASAGAQIGDPMNMRSAVSSVAFSTDGARIFSGDAAGTVRLWDADTETSVGIPMTGHQHAVLSIAFSPDGARIISGGSDGTLRLWDARTGKQIGGPMTSHEGWITSVAFSTDGARIVSGGDDGTIRLWDARTGKQIEDSMTGHQHRVNSVAFSPDGTQIVSGGGDGTVRLWDARTGKQIGDPMAGHFYVSSVAFSPDGARIVSGGGFRVSDVRLWDASTGAQIGDPMVGHEGSVFSVAFSPDGARVVSGGEDGTVRLWNVDYGPGSIFEVFCRRLPTRDPPAIVETYGIDLGEPICSGEEPLPLLLPQEAVE